MITVAISYLPAMDISPDIKYCLYARKSSESDERQAMSIDSQIKEMGDLAKKENLIISEVRQESHSAKESGQRPVFVQLLNDIRNGMFTGILTWAPDRLSRNAGDLGMLVDLMDQEKLFRIRTFSQIFSNNPNEKFLLMILCSQAKLENDNRGINVKRGIRAKCEMGWRPGAPPLGYYNRSFAGVKDIVVDPDRKDVVAEMFNRVAKKGDSGRKIKLWFDQIGFTTRAGKSVTLSMVYMMLNNPFYYGSFEYPIKSGNWYQGKHQPLISKELYNQVQQQLITCPKSKWGAKEITFKGLFKCGNCRGNMVGEDRLRKRKIGPARQHIYYHCARQLGKCREPYISEEKLIDEIIKYIGFMETVHPGHLKMMDSVNKTFEEYKRVKEEVLYQRNINPKTVEFTLKEYAKYTFRYGKKEDKQELVKMLGKMLYIRDRTLSASAEPYSWSFQGKKLRGNV